MQIVIALVLLTSLLVRGLPAEEPAVPVMKLPLPFDWSGAGMSIKVRNAEGQTLWDDTFRPIEYSNEKSLEQIESRDFAPGQGTILVDTESAGNVIMFAHSGTFQGEPLEGETFRRVFEDRLWGYALPTEESSTVINQSIRDNMESFVGSYVTMMQGAGAGAWIRQDFQVMAVAYIPHGEPGSGTGTDLFGRNTKDILLVSSLYASVAEDPHFAEWVNAQGGSDQYVLFTFCGWGPITPNPDTWYVYTRYVVLLKPIQPDEVRVHRGGRA